MITLTSFCRKDIHFHVSLWSEAMEPWLAFVETGWRCINITVIFVPFDWLVINLYFDHVNKQSCLTDEQKVNDSKFQLKTIYHNLHELKGVRRSINLLDRAPSFKNSYW